MRANKKNESGSRGGRRGRSGRSPNGTRAGASSSPLGPGLLAAEVEVKERDVETRSFPHNVKQQCWEKADRIKGRDPDRWRRDSLGNTVFRKLVGCPGCLCHDYDHIVPYSKFACAWRHFLVSCRICRASHNGGGKSTLENCQVLQATVNRSKGNKTEISKAELIQKSAYCRVSGRDMDLLELSAYGNVRRGQDSGSCNIQ